jgi:hypothetical protein
MSETPAIQRAARFDAEANEGAAEPRVATQIIDGAESVIFRTVTQR